MKPGTAVSHSVPAQPATTSRRRTPGAAWALGSSPRVHKASFQQIQWRAGATGASQVDHQRGDGLRVAARA
eukprot:1133598-Pyramimonas_sp.AAC.1